MLASSTIRYMLYVVAFLPAFSSVAGNNAEVATSLIQSALYKPQGKARDDGKKELSVESLSKVIEPDTARGCSENLATFDRFYHEDPEDHIPGPKLGALDVKYIPVQQQAPADMVSSSQSHNGVETDGIATSRHSETTDVWKPTVLGALSILCWWASVILYYLRKPPDTKSADGRSHLVVALGMGRTRTGIGEELMGYLCSFSKDSTDDWGCTALHYAASKCDIQAAVDLLDNGAIVDAREAWEETPLHLAAKAGHVQICSLLIDHGADVDAKNMDDQTTLLLAGVAGHEAVVELLLDRGATTGGAMEKCLPPVLASALVKRIACAG